MVAELKFKGAYKARTDNSNKHVGVLNLKSKRVDEFLSQHLKNRSTIINFLCVAFDVASERTESGFHTLTTNKRVPW